MPRSLVCGIDASEESRAAAPVAARLARRLGLKLVVGQVLEPATSFPYENEVQFERRWRRAAEQAASLCERIKRRLSGVDVDARVLNDAPEQAYPALAAAEDAALLIVGSRGPGRIKAALLGSTPSTVVRASDRPVVIVPPEASAAVDREASEHLTVVCGVDGSDEANGAARVAARLAAALRLELVLVHAYEPPSSSAAIPAPGVAPPIKYEALNEEQRDRAQTLLEAVARNIEADAPTRMRVAVGDAASALNRSAKEQRAELIVVGTRGRGPLASALLGSTSGVLAASASKPVVVVPNGALLQIESAADTAAPDLERP